MGLELFNMIAPGTGGIVTDKPDWAIGVADATHIVDAINYEGILTQRRGWAYYRTAVPNAASLTSASRFLVPFTNTTVDIVSGLNNASPQASTIWAWNGSDWQAVITPFGSPLPDYIARAQYQDEILLCDQNGVYPMLRFMGRISSPGSGYSAAILANSPILTLGTGAGTVPIGILSSGATVVTSTAVSSAGVAGPGSYVHPIGSKEVPSFRVERRDAGSADFSLKNVKFATAFTAGANETAVTMYGTAWPAVSVNNDGLVTPAASTALAGTGTTFNGTGAVWGNVTVGTGANVGFSDSIRIQYAAKWSQYGVASVGSDTALTLRQTAEASAATSYDVMRRLPFTDVEVHKECLWGCGVKQYPSRVYYSPRNWDMQTPPEMTTPWNGVTDFYEEGTGKLRYVDVTGENSGDPVRALLSSDGALLILTARAVYGVFGNWPDFTRQTIAHGAGCIDSRSAIAKGAYGQFWAGENGIYGYRSGTVSDLTSGKINTEWRDLMRRYDKSAGSFVAAGLVMNHMIVSAYVTTGGTEQRTYACNLGTGSWTRLANTKVVGFYDPGLWGEGEKLLAVLQGSTRPVDIAPAINMSGISRDENGVSPLLYYSSGTGVHNQGDPNDESRLVEVRVIADNYEKIEEDPPSVLSVSVVSSGALDRAATDPITTAAGTITADQDPRIKRKRMDVGAVGRQHQIIVQTTTTASTNTKIALNELGMNIRKRRKQK